MHAIRRGADPLGDVFCALRSARERRSSGAVPTPPAIVDSMLASAEAQGNPCRVVNPGAGPARFLAGAGRKFPDATLVAADSEPLAALTARGNLAASGMAARSEVRVENFLFARLDRIGGQTMFVGNRPYVRHHLIPPAWKGRLKAESSALGVRASAVAGLHAYFFLAIAKLGAPGDFGALITSAEWLDVKHGKLIRDLFLGALGGRSMFIVAPQSEPFPGTAKTGAVTTFRTGSAAPTARFARGATVPDGGCLCAGRSVPGSRLTRQSRWSDFTGTLPKVPDRIVELGEICRVHREQVTGANKVWIASPHSAGPACGGPVSSREQGPRTPRLRAGLAQCSESALRDRPAHRPRRDRRRRARGCGEIPGASRADGGERTLRRAPTEIPVVSRPQRTPLRSSPPMGPAALPHSSSTVRPRAN